MCVSTTMLSLFEIINKFTGNKIPPIMRGTKALIEQMAEEERKINEMNRLKTEKAYTMIRPKEEISEIFTKYVNKGYNKEAYLFIK